MDNSNDRDKSNTEVDVFFEARTFRAAGWRYCGRDESQSSVEVVSAAVNDRRDAVDADGQ